MDDFKCFAYITKDHDKQNYYCHVFSAFNLVCRPIFFKMYHNHCNYFFSQKDMANEILLTLGQAFEIAYRLEIGETIDSLRKLYIRSKLTKSIVDPPARLSSDVRSSGHTLSESQFNMAFRAASHTLFRTRRDDGRRHSSGSSAPVNVKHANAHSDRVRVSDTDGSNADSIDLKLIGEPRIAMNPARSSGREKPAVPIKPPHIHHHQHHALHANSHHLFYPHGTSPSGSEAGKPRAK